MKIGTTIAIIGIWTTSTIATIMTNVPQIMIAPCLGTLFIAISFMIAEA